MCDQPGTSGGSTPTGSGSAPTTPSVAATSQPQMTPTPPQSVTPIAMQQQQQQGMASQPQTPTQQLQAVQPQQIQQLQSHTQLQQVQSAQMHQINNVVRSSLPAQVQVIQPMGTAGGQFVSHQYMQQQLMLQNAGLQTMQPQTFNTQLGQMNNMGQVCPVSVTLSTPKSPGLMSPMPASSQGTVTVAVTGGRTTMIQAKAATGIALPQPQQQQQGGQMAQTATPLYSQKQVIQHRQATGPVVIGQLAGVLSNQGMAGQTIQVSQAKSPAISSMPQSPISAHQVFNSPAQIRFGHQTFVTNNGQILGGNISNGMLNQFGGFQATAIQGQGIPLVTQQQLIAGSQNATILTTQPVYLRAAGPIHTQGIVGNVQAVAPTKGKQSSPASAVSSASQRGPQARPTSSVSSTIPSPSASNSLGDSARVRGMVHSKTTTTTTTTTTNSAQHPRIQTVNAQGLGGVVKTISTVQGLRTISTVQGLKNLTVGQALKALSTGTVSSSTSGVMAAGKASPQMHGNQQGLHKGVANILPQGTRTVAPSGGQIQQVQVAAPGMAVQPQMIKTIQPLQQLGGQPQGQQKQVSKVKAMKQQPKTNSPVPTTQVRLGTGQQQSRLGVAGRPPMVMVQPKPKATSKAGEGSGAQTVAVQAMTGTAQVILASGPGTVQGEAAAAASASTGAASASPGTTGTLAPTEIKQEEMDTTGLGAAPASSASTEDGTIPQHNGSAAADKQMAVCKPNVLTHVIEGFVIQEAPEPFPVQRSSVLSELMSIHSSDFSDISDSDGAEKDSQDEGSQKAEQGGDEDVLKLRCEFCGRMEPCSRFRRSKRFCSVACAKRYNVGCTRRMGLFQSRHRAKLTSLSNLFMKKKKTGLSVGNGVKKTWKRDTGGRVTTGPIQRTSETPVLTSLGLGPNNQDSGSSSTSSLPVGPEPLPSAAESSSETERSTSPSAQEETSSAPRSPPELQRVEVDMEGDDGPREEGDGEVPSLPTNRHPSLWNVQDVYDFIASLQGCEMYADEFSRQEIDGQALMLLKEDHLMTAMNIKLGPALKICARIKTLKEELNV